MIRLIDQHLKEVEVRRTVSNWPETIRSIVDGYRGYTTISHAVQKDAIQNGWSARKDKRKGKGWNLIFELVEEKNKKFLLMTDSGTTGLTGRVLTPEEYEKDLPKEERWGRFEGIAFTQPRGERTIGSRGRGKFIFVGASKEHTILYDTLRDDGTYRFGFRTIIRTESPVAAYEGEKGKKKLQEITGGILKPLSVIGTRVIIVDPVDEVINDIKNGDFLRHIEETWWEIIQKYNAKIIVRINDNRNIAGIPEKFKLEKKDSRNFKVWIKPVGRIPVGGRDFHTKKLHIIYNVIDSAPEDIRGIAIQRGGMKICSLELRYLSKEIADKIYGYITLDTSTTEEAILEDEGPEHYSYDFRRSLPGAIKRYIEDEILRFAREKLNYGVDTREIKRQQQRNAERRALIVTNKFARALGIGLGPGTTREGTGGLREAKLIRIQMDELVLPRKGDLRVNYGETAQNIKARIVNDAEQDILVKFKLFLRFFDKPIKTYIEKDVTIPAKSVTKFFGSFQEKFTKETFPDTGKYTVVAKIISLREEDKGTEFDYKTKSFYLEEDPPMKGLFERCEAFGFPDEEPVKYWFGYSEIGSERGLVLYYNLNHPSYFSVAENENDLTEFILRIAGYEICRYDLLQESPKLFKEEEREDPQAILIQTRKIIGELLYKFHKEEI